MISGAIPSGAAPGGRLGGRGRSVPGRVTLLRTPRHRWRIPIIIIAGGSLVIAIPVPATLLIATPVPAAGVSRTHDE